MADDVFALSPISARATLPSEEDYAAIAEAFMETSRGRWFLTEYAKRNRNADTRMVLDAVARIEQNLERQREEEREREAKLQREEGLSAQQAQEAVAAAAAATERLTEALAAIRNSVALTEESAVEALDSLALEQRLAPVRKGARVLREIAWRLREIGNDGRICDLIDSQVSVIEKGTDQLSTDEARAALRAAFAALQSRLVEFSDDDAAAETEAAAAPSVATPALDQVAEIAQRIFAKELAKEAAHAASAAKLPAMTANMRAEAAHAGTAAPAQADIAGEEATVAQTAFESADPQNVDLQDSEGGAADAFDTADTFGAAGTFDAAETLDAADTLDAHVGDADAADAEAHDEAILDMVAMEMGAPDPIADDEIELVEPAHSAEPAPAAPAIAAKALEAVAAPSVQHMVQAAPAPPDPVPAPAVEMSLGSSLLASGLLKKPITAANDPLAPIRRMSQAEKIAFFS